MILKVGKEQISEWLSKSALVNYDHLIIELGYEEPIIQVKTNVFAKNWDDFVAASGFMGITCLTSDGKLLMEFSDDAEYQLYSNFRIKQ